jgi:hypothetical protein
MPTILPNYSMQKSGSGSLHLLLMKMVVQNYSFIYLFFETFYYENFFNIVNYKEF